MQPIAAARLTAFEVLLAAENGAYASDELRQQSVNLDGRDAGLAAQIVFGCLRFQSQLDFLLTKYSGRRAEDLDETVRIALRAAIFQMRYLERIPAHAAVHNSVEFVKKRQRAATGLANAVLRKVNRDTVAWPDAATALACPAWLLKRWTAKFGEGQAREIAQAALLEPLHYVRAVAGEAIPEGAEATEVAGCFRLASGTVTALRQHDIGSQSIVPLLQLQPGLTFLDVCAAPGNKTGQALETALALAVACDVSAERLREVTAAPNRVVLDATQTLPFAQSFDRILLDAPCSGTGTLGRNPEIKWRLEPGDFARYRRKQTGILKNALAVLKPGGLLVYATCSLEQDENEDVVKAALHGLPEFRCVQQDYRIPGRDEGDGFFRAVVTRQSPA